MTMLFHRIIPQKPNHWRKKTLEATKIYRLWYGIGSATIEERISGLLKYGYSAQEITKGFRLKPSSASYCRSNTNTVKANLIWEDIKSIYDYRCAYCGKKSNHLTKDHVVSLKNGGVDRMDNIVPACFSCNRRKNARKLLDWDGFYKLQLHLLGFN